MADVGRHINKLYFCLSLVAAEASREGDIDFISTASLHTFHWPENHKFIPLFSSLKMDSYQLCSVKLTWLAGLIKKSECVFKLLTLHITLSHGGCNEWKWAVQFNSLWPSGIRIALHSICLEPLASWWEGATHLYFIFWTIQVVKINKRGYRINGMCRSCSQRCEEENGTNRSP